MNRHCTVLGSVFFRRRDVPRTWALGLLGFAAIQVYPQQAAGQVLITGSVRDSVTRFPLASAHIIMEGSNRGTITNREGDFELTLSHLPATLVFRHIGYHPMRVELMPDDARTLHISLEPAAIELPELLITGDYLATAIMQEVIRRKAARRRRLNAHNARVYARITLQNRDRIVLVSEAVFDRYYSRGSGIREVIRSRRQTSDFHEELGLKLTPQDFSSDQVHINGLPFFGPTHPDALEHYTFTFAGRRVWNGQQLYDIYVAPKGNQEATFIGRISVLDSLYALIEVDLKPASHVVFSPDTRDWSVQYRQNFAQVDSFWLPIDLQLQGWIHVAPDGERVSPAVVEQTARLMDYEANQPVPAGPFTREEPLQTDTTSVLRDDLFLMGLDMVALTARELEALGELRWKKPLTLREAFPPTSVLASEFELYNFQIWDRPQFSFPVVGGFSPWFAFNRVDGTRVGAGRVVTVGDDRKIAARIGQSIGYGRTRLNLAWNQRGTRFSQTSVVYRQNTRPQNGILIHTEALNTLSSSVFAEDYFDWYWSRSLRVSRRYEKKGIRMMLSGEYAFIESIDTHIESPWPWKKKFPDNPAIHKGQRQTLEFRFGTGKAWNPYHVHPRKSLEVRTEFAHSTGGYDDLRTTLLADYYIPTFMRRRPAPLGLSLRILGGIITRGAQRDQWHVAEGSIASAGELGTLRTLRNHRLIGRQMIGGYWEHDFRSVLFEALRLRPLVGQNISIRFGGAHVYMNGRWIHEVSLSIARAPLRINFTRSMDEPRIFLGVGFAGRN